MSSRSQSLVRSALAGLRATLAMDVAARTVVAPALGTAPLGPDGLGRWVGQMRHGRFVHANIAAAPRVRNEAAIGIVSHYAIGAGLGTGYELLQRATGRRGSPSLAVAYGTATTVFSWFLMFPAVGQGLLGRRQSRRLAALSLCNHIVYGLGLAAALLALPARTRNAAATAGTDDVRELIPGPARRTAKIVHTVGSVGPSKRGIADPVAARKRP